MGMIEHNHKISGVTIFVALSKVTVILQALVAKMPRWISISLLYELELILSWSTLQQLFVLLESCRLARISRGVLIQKWLVLHKVITCFIFALPPTRGPVFGWEFLMPNSAETKPLSYE